MYRRVKIFFGNNRSKRIYFLKDITEYGGGTVRGLFEKRPL